MMHRDHFQIHFAKSRTGQVKSNKDLLSISYDLILWVPEIDSFFEELKNKEIRIIEEITRRSYGSCEFSFEDIDGHHILISD